MMLYRKLEEMVHAIAYSIWGIKTEKVQENGINHDCVIKLQPDYWIIIETSVRNDLDKIREDINRLLLSRSILMPKGIYTKCFFVSEKEIPPNVKNTGKEANVDILSMHEFQNLFFNYSNYATTRLRYPFGSAVDPHTGAQDSNKYITVKYQNSDSGAELSFEEIADLLLKGSRIILTGDYGSGKSRCLKELFSYMSNRAQEEFRYAIAINLKENWGLKRGEEIIRRHFHDIGMSESAETVLRNYRDNRFCMLLDGFDEIGSQSWSNDPKKIVEIRKESLIGVKDLITECGGGLIIAGRDYYFNSTSEMLDCLGLNPQNTTAIIVREEFTEKQVNEYFSFNLHNTFEIPEWMPKKPLVFQMLSKLDNEILGKIAEKGLEFREFWGLFIDTVCEREAKINIRLDAEKIKQTLIRLARITRNIPESSTLSLSMIEKAFEEVTDKAPVEESSIMLQRLPFLRRAGIENQDRQFYDNSIANILRAMDVISIVRERDSLTIEEIWSLPMEEVGIAYLASEIAQGDEYEEYYAFLITNATKKNKILFGEIITAMLEIGIEKYDFKGLVLNDTHIKNLDLSGVDIARLSVTNSIINSLNISGICAESLEINECLISKITGIASESGLPDFIKNCMIENYEVLNTLSRIKKSDASVSQVIFLSIVKKTFFQPGSGRKEEALYRGFGDKENRRLFDKIINKLVYEDVLSKTKGDAGNLYIPNRKYTVRMKRIMESLSYSDDPLWKEIIQYK